MEVKVADSNEAGSSDQIQITVGNFNGEQCTTPWIDDEFYRPEIIGINDIGVSKALFNSERGFYFLL